MAESTGNSGGFHSGEVTGTNGTATALASSTLGGDRRYRAITIRAKAGNTGQVFVGGSDVTTATNDGLDAGEILNMASPGGIDISDIYIDVDTTSDGVDWYGLN